MDASANIKEAKLCKKSEPCFRTWTAEWNKFFAAPKHTRIGEAIDILLEEVHDLEDRAAGKRDVCLQRAVEKAILQVHEVADVLESLEDQLGEAT
jgi:hypothetical protein